MSALHRQIKRDILFEIIIKLIWTHASRTMNRFVPAFEEALLNYTIVCILFSEHLSKLL